MHFERLETGKKQYLELLLLADEQESMVDRYLERGEMFLLKNDALEVVAEAVVTKEDKGVFEIKNLAVKPEYQRQGYGRQMIAFLLNHYREQGHTMMVGTGESAKTMAFYQACGFSFSHRLKDFFLENYDHPIVEEGKLLKDMVYFKCDLRNNSSANFERT